MNNDFKLSENLIPAGLLDQFKDIDLQKLQDSVPTPQFDILKPDIPDIKNPMVEEQKRTNELVNQLQSQLTSIQYENMKLNTQIEVLNHTIDSNNEKLDELRTANSKLKIVNQTLEKNNKHYWLFSTIITIAGAVIGYLLGTYC